MVSDATIATVASTIKGVVNRGTLNWSGSNTTYTVSAGYYTGGTLDSRTSYNNGYSTGRTQGRTDVKNSPNSYSLYTKAQYDTNYTNGYNAGSNVPIYAIGHYAISPASKTTYYVPNGSLNYCSSNMSISGNKVVVAKSGKYRIIILCAWTGSAVSNAWAKLYINGTNNRSLGFNGHSAFSSCTSVDISLSAGNTIQIRTGKSGGSSDIMIHYAVLKIG